jgi:hypothetical protein
MMCWSEAAEPRAWAERWIGAWSGPSLLAPGRAVLIERSQPVPTHDCSAAPGWNAPVPPGGRLVIVARVTAEQVTGANWLTAWADAGLLPEIAHACTPVPGDPAFGPVWLRGHGTPGADGRYTLGCVLGRLLSAQDVGRRRFSVERASPLIPRYFPLAEGDRLPFPVSGGNLTGRAIADAFGLAMAPAAVLVSELIWAGVLQVVP